MNPDPIESPPDPATPARRLELCRMLLVCAIHDYEAAHHRWATVNESYPALPYCRPPLDEAAREERGAWKRLLAESDDDFNLAELALAQRIQALYDELAPEGRRAGDDEGEYFVPRAVRHHGSIYVLAYGVGQHEPRTNIIATYRAAMTLDLDAAPGGPDADLA